MPPAIPSLVVSADGAGLFEAVGAQVYQQGVFYRVWAPDHSSACVRIEGTGGSRTLKLQPRKDGYFSGRDEAGKAGDRYRFQLAGDDEALPDPASRFQPKGVHGSSEVVDPTAYHWKTDRWRRPSFHGRVIYELHVGTFTPAGTFAAAIDKLDALVDLGVNTIELMPLGDFAGTRNWGYDGVMPFAPARCYGRPDDLRALVDAAHARGLAVVLDVIYNHLGAVGNILPRFSSTYFHRDRKNMWGQVLNFDRDALPVRRFFIQNACMWLDEYRFDGLRLDAVHAIEDKSPTHIVADIVDAAKVRGAFVIAEDERNEVKIITPAAEGGWGVAGVWADDFHHTARVALTGQHESHFGSFRGGVEEWVRTLRQGWLYQGQYYPHKEGARGSPAGHRPPAQFIYCISNHDQVGNRPLGERLNHSVSPAAYRALSMLLCLVPYTPMLFMGQEWAAGTPFVFFTDLPGEIGEKIAENRKEEFARYGADYDPAMLDQMRDPQSAEAFSSSKLDWTEREQTPHQRVLALYRACLRLRAEESVFQSAPRDRWVVGPAGNHLLGLRWSDTGGDWLLLIGVKTGEHTTSDEPCLRGKPGRRWRLEISSNAPEFGGPVGDPLLHVDGSCLTLKTPAAVLLRETSTHEIG